MSQEASVEVAPQTEQRTERLEAMKSTSMAVQPAIEARNTSTGVKVCSRSVENSIVPPRAFTASYRR
jgi:hypothetical protein